jgi:hypothetical protein
MGEGVVDPAIVAVGCPGFKHLQRGGPRAFRPGRGAQYCVAAEGLAVEGDISFEIVVIVDRHHVVAAEDGVDFL